ncbi:MAG: hypothetical protein ACI4RA_07340 [Kiritimatiellia bacterium]
MTRPLFALVLGAALLCGCATEHYVTDARHPEIAITEDGGVTYRGEFVDPEDLPGLLRRSGLDRHDTINIHCPETMTDWRLQRKVMAILSRNGFTRPVLVGDRRAYSEVGRTAEERRRARVRQQREEARPAPRGRTPVRYKN